MRKVGSEVGLFYYYFENKDDVFDKAVHRFLAQYEAGMEDIVQRIFLTAQSNFTMLHLTKQEITALV